MDPCILVIFGGTGDLTRRKLYPALCNLYRDCFLKVLQWFLSEEGI